MDKLFRQVSVKERLPEKSGKYNTELGQLEFSINPCYKNNGIWLNGNYVNHPTIWLEEVELPTNSEIDWKYPLNVNEPHKTTLNVGCRTGAKWVIDTLKGEKK